MNNFKCPETIEALEELEKLIPLCRKDLYAQAKARIESGSACSLSEASRQLGDELDKNPDVMSIMHICMIKHSGKVEKCRDWALGRP